MVKPITIFISYAHKDASFLQEMRTFLKPYERQKIISIWTDKDIVAGQKWDELIRLKLHESEIVLFLVSPDFLASDYINDKEIEEVLDKDKSYTVPILIRPIANLNLLKINQFQVIPTGARPVTNWTSRDEAWNDVVNQLDKIFALVNPALSGDVKQDGKTEIPGSSSSKREMGNPFDVILKVLLLLLISMCVAAFAHGLMKHDSFYSYASLAGITAGFSVYMFIRR